MNNGLTAERMMDSFPLALQKDPKMVALAHSIANVLEQRLDEINLGQIYTRIDELPEDLLDILAKDFAVDWYDKSHLQGCHKEKPPEMDGFNYFRYSPRPEGGSLGYSSSSKLSNGPLRPERWSLVYSTFSSTPLSISFLACAEGSAE